VRFNQRRHQNKSNSTLLLPYTHEHIFQMCPVTTWVAITMTSHLGDQARAGGGVWAGTKTGANAELCWAGAGNGASIGIGADAGAWAVSADAAAWATDVGASALSAMSSCFSRVTATLVILNPPRREPMV
jgi:hypothetical protein